MLAAFAVCSTCCGRLRPSPTCRGWEWRYLWQLGHEDRLRLRAQEDNFAALAFSPDGKTLAGLEAQGRIRLWDRRTGRSLRTTGVMTGGRHADLAGGVSAAGFQPRRPQPCRAGPRGEPHALRRRHGPAHAELRGTA